MKKPVDIIKLAKTLGVDTIELVKIVISNSFTSDAKNERKQ